VVCDLRQASWGNDTAIWHPQQPSHEHRESARHCAIPLYAAHGLVFNPVDGQPSGFQIADTSLAAVPST
jgi:hypothetical protein